MPFRTVDTNSRNSVFNYLEDVLDYYKTAENATLSEWPAIEKGYEPFQKNESFYRHAMSWFINRNINVIKHNKKNRYLSTFILAAEFPPTLGYGRADEKFFSVVPTSPWVRLLTKIIIMTPKAIASASRLLLRFCLDTFL